MSWVTIAYIVGGILLALTAGVIYEELKVK